MAARAGLQAGDTILAIDGREVPASSTAVARVVRAIVYGPPLLPLICPGCVWKRARSAHAPRECLTGGGQYLG